MDDETRQVVPADEQQEQQPTVPASDSSSSQVAEVRITRSDLDQAISDAANAAAAGVTTEVAGGFASLGASLGEVSKELSTAGTVTLVPEQYQTFAKLGATSLRTDIVVCGLLALLLGSVIGVAITLHWRAGRG